MALLRKEKFMLHGVLEPLKFFVMLNVLFPTYPKIYVQRSKLLIQILILLFSLVMRQFHCYVRCRRLLFLVQLFTLKRVFQTYGSRSHFQSWMGNSFFHQNLVYSYWISKRVLFFEIQTLYALCSFQNY